MEKPCENCGTVFRFKPSHVGRAKFCSKRCLGISNGARVKSTGSGFQNGLVPWSKTHAKGMHLSPASEFKPGQRPANWAPIGTVKIRKFKRDTSRAFVKVAEPNVWKLRAVLTWEAKHGPLPKGHLVHHRDRNSLNDSPDNLQKMTRREHNLEHQIELVETRRQAIQARGGRRRATA